MVWCKATESSPGFFSFPLLKGGLAFLAVLALVLLCPLAASADVVHLKNGNTISGKILEEGNGEILVSTGVSELTVPTSSIDRIERGFPTELVLRKARRSLEAGQELMKRGNRGEARRTFEAALISLEDDTATLDELPEEIEEAREKLDQARQNALPPDPASQKAEQLYQRALKEIDHLDYSQAYEILREAVELKPDRADIQYRLGRIARRVERPEASIEAFQSALRLDPDTYYKDVSDPLLELLHTEGRKLANSRRAEQAIPLFQEILILQDEQKGKGEAVELEKYLAKKTSLEKKPEDEVLMEVYRYADSNDLVDLAFAAVSRAADLRPEDKEIQRLKGQTGFLSKLKARMDQGDVGGAAELVAEAPPEISESEEMAGRIDKMTGNMSKEIEARKLLLKTREAFESGDFRKAAALARRLATEYHNTDAASEAAELLREAELEAPVKEALDEVAELIEQGDFDAAEARIDEVLGMENIDSSDQYQNALEIKQRLPEEREAERLYNTARTQLDRGQFDQALTTLDQIVTQFPNTRAGQRAAKWLKDYRKQLAREARTTELFETNSIFAFADPNLWRAASYPASNNSSRMRVPKVRDAMRGRLTSLFDDLVEQESEVHAETRSAWLHIGLPLALGGLILAGLFWKLARPGRERMRELEEVTNATDAGSESEFEASHSLTVCRMCGLDMPPGSLICPECGAPTKLSEIEQQRETADSREADYDPWKIRVKAQEKNDFQTYFEKAQDLAETSDTQAAIDQCLRALQEDPHRKEGFALLAELYERAGKPDEAAKCYREILLLDPTDIVTRQKVESLLQLVNAPLRMNGVIITLSILIWWMLFWLVLGLDPYMWWLRLILSVAGCVLTAWLLIRYQQDKRVSIHGQNRAVPDVHRPLPKKDLSWKEQNRQARIIAEEINEHTGVEVPVLSTWRIAGAVLLSALLLGVMVLIHWTNDAPLVFLGWPAGVVLFFYLLEIHPRILCASAILRHCFEETSSPWADPHRPFIPKGEEKAAGEFLVRSYDEFPLRWALNPRPYRPTRQGILNSIQQTLNRHWACHRFYRGLHVVRDVDFPYPLRFKKTITLLSLIMIVSLGCAAAISFLESAAKDRYVDSLRIGYLHLLDGEMEAARDEFLRAARAERERALPHLYLAHVNSALGFDHSAERAYKAAINRTNGMAVPYNDYGNFLQRHGRIQEALQYYRKALEYDPNNGNIYNNLGAALYKLQDYDKAARYLEQATSIDAKNSRAYITLGLAYEAMGRREEAREAFTKAVELAPELDYTEVARQHLETGDEAPSEIPGLEISMAEKQDDGGMNEP